MEVGNVVISWVGNARLLCIAFNLQIDFQYQSVLSKPDTSPPPTPLPSVRQFGTQRRFTRPYVCVKEDSHITTGCRGVGCFTTAKGG